MKHHDPKHHDFLHAIAHASAGHKPAAADFVVVKKDQLEAALPSSAKKEASVCVLWGFNPATGEEICLQWS